MFIKNMKLARAITFIVCAVLLAAMSGMSSAAGPIWSQTGTGVGAAYRISMSPGYKTDKTAFWVWGDSNICRTSDGFSSWTTVYNTGDPLKRMQAVGVSPSFLSDGTVFGGSDEEGAAGTGSVVKSTDGGLSWAPAALGSYSIIHAESVAFSPGFSNSGSGRVFIGTNKGGLSSNNGRGVVYSDNGGSSWNGSTGLPNYAGVVSVAVSPGYGTDHTLFAAVDADNATGSIYRSQDSGASWSKLSMTRVHVASPFNAIDVAVSPDYSNDHSVFAVSRAQGLYRSTDGGDNWTPLYNKPGMLDLPMSSVDLSPNYANDHTLFVATDSQSPDSVFMSTDQGENWQEITTDSESFNVYNLAVSPDYRSDRTLFVGTKNSGIWAYTGVIPTPLSTITDPVDGALMSHGFVSYSITGTASCTDGINKVEVSTDGGASWHTVSGTTSWSYAWANPGPGVYNILSKATSDADVIETPSPGITVRVDRYSLSTSTVPADGSCGTVAKSAPSVPPYYGYNEGATLTANPAAGYALKAWGGDASGSSSPVIVSMTTDKSVTATFTHTYSLSVNANNSLYGSAAILPVSGPYFSDTPVSLTATANPGYRFTGWTGSTTGIANTANASASFTMGSGNRTITANFIAVYTLTVNKNIDAGGTVTGGGTFDAGTANVPVSATVNPGYNFTGWTGDTVAAPGSLSTTVPMMDANKTVSANFVILDGLRLSMSQIGTSVTCNVVYTVSGVPQSGKAIKLYSKLHSATTWTLKATVSTSATGTLSKAITLANGTYDLKAVYSTTTSNVAACVVAAVAVPAQGVTNPTTTADPTPTLSWSAFTGATGYVIQTCAASTFAAGTYTETPNLGNVTSAALPASMSLPRGVKKYWRIVALIPTGRSVPSAARYVTYKENTSFTGLSANASAMKIQPSVTLAGADGGIPSGKTVTFYYKKDSATTWSSATAVTGSTGLAKLSLPKALTANGAYHLYAKFAGDASYAAVTSAQVPFTLPATVALSGRDVRRMGLFQPGTDIYIRQAISKLKGYKEE